MNQIFEQKKSHKTSQIMNKYLQNEKLSLVRQNSEAIRKIYDKFDYINI